MNRHWISWLENPNNKCYISPLYFRKPFKLKEPELNFEINLSKLNHKVHITN